MIYQVEATRDKILDVAEELFLEQGFFDTQMKDIAVRMGMSRHTLYRYFQDKEDLGYVIVGKILDKLKVQMQQGLEVNPEPDSDSNVRPNVREQIINCLEAMFTNPDNETDMRFMAEFDAFFSGCRLSDKFVEKLAPSAHGRDPLELEALLKRGVEEGSIRADIEPSVLFYTCLYSIKTLQQLVVSRGGALLNVPQEYERQFLQTLVRLLDDGLKPQADK